MRQKAIFIWSQIVLFVCVCVFFNYVSDVFHPPHSKENHIHKILYIDSTFSESEIADITEAAIAWTTKTHYIAQFDVVTLPTDKKIDLSKALFVLKVTPGYPEVVLLDGFNHDSTLGYYHDKGAAPYVGLISARIEGSDYKAVVLHELGHALGLKHATNLEDMGTLMYPTIDYGSDCITHKDMEQFCSIYHCNADQL